MGNFKKVTLVLLAGLLCLFFLSSCSFSGAGSENLRYPKQSNKESMVYEFLSEHTEDNYSLVYASRGNYQNPILFTDLDGDGKDEVVISYVPVITSEKHIRTVILKENDDGDYLLYGEVAGLSDKLDKIEFCDMDSDGQMELVIGYGSLTEYYPSRLSIIHYDGEAKNYSLEYMAEYYDFLCTDFNRDGMSEVLNISYSGLSSSNATAFCIIYDFVIEDFRTLTGGAFLSNAGECYRVLADRTADGSPAVYITAPHGSLLKSTEIVIWNTALGIPRNLSLDGFSALKEDFIYYGSAVAQDIDGDGVIEYPVSEVIDETVISQDIRDSVNAQSMEMLQYTCSWYYIDDGAPVYDFSCYMNTELNYYVTIKNPARYTDVKVYMDSSGNFLFYYDKENGVKELLFSVIASTSAPADEATQLLYISKTGTYLSYIVNPDLDPEMRDKLIPIDELLQSITVTGIMTATG